MNDNTILLDIEDILLLYFMDKPIKSELKLSSVWKIAKYINVNYKHINIDISKNNFEKFINSRYFDYFTVNPTLYKDGYKINRSIIDYTDDTTFILDYKIAYTKKDFIKLDFTEIIRDIKINELLNDRKN